MKELFLITAYIPDERRKSMLRNFVEKLQNYDYDIMICSHCIIPEDILKKVDYHLYEKKNLLKTGFTEKFNLWYGLENFRIISTEVAKFNHIGAIIRSLGLGLNTAKNMGYKKVHYFEYDTDFDHLDEIVDNSNLLEEYSSVYYLGSPAGPNSPVSLNLGKISEKWFSYGYEYIDELLEVLPFKTLEEYEQKLFDESKSFIKDQTKLHEKGLRVGLNSLSSFNDWNVFFVEGDDFKFFSWNNTDEVRNIKLIINDNNLIKFDVIPGVWNIRDIDKLDHISSAIIIVDDEIKQNYKFDDKTKLEFKSTNYIDVY
jgi:hypothetical protein